MKIKFKLSILVIAIMAVVVTVISAILLRRASDISVELSLRGLKSLAIQRTEYWKGVQDGNIRVLHTLASVMSEYESIPAETRRDRFDEILLGTVNSETSMVNLYTVWKPNALDGMDADFIGRTGSTATGQYGMAYSRETGRMEGRVTADIDAAMAYLSGPNSGKDRVEHPIPRMVNGKASNVVRMMVPVINPRTNEVVGGVGSLIDTSSMQTALEQTVRDNEEISVMVIYSGNGTILSHFIPERVGKMMTDVDMEYGKNINLAYQAVLDGKPYRDIVYDPSLKTNIDFNILPFRIGDSNTTWSVMMGSTEEYVLSEVRSITRFTIVLAVIGILAAAGILFIVLGRVIRPIISVTNTLKDISEGEGDLTRVIPEKGNDEITDLSRHFNKTLEKIRNLIVNIKQQTVMLFDTGNELASNMTQTAAAVNQITANIQNIQGQVINQSASVTETNATMEQITVNIDKLNTHVTNQSSSVSQSSSAIEQMLANVESVTQTLFKNEKNVEELMESSEIGRNSLHDVVEDIRGIAQESEGLLAINAVMNDIASQTNLLSMNAAIEAAHAGAAGKGFAVVADEIRKLAENSGEQSRTISVVLKKIKDSIDKITQSTENVLGKFETIDTGVKVVANQEGYIRNAMEEQGQGSNQILTAIGQLGEITQQVKDGSREMLSGSREVIQESKNLEIVTNEITGGMNEMAVGAEQINVAVNRVNEISARNKINIDQLVREVSRFKVE
ncbi:MAG: methyl-accepting chemotaxis protein [Treponema sp.]|nr:methyl-accepting chemotaxis protein [Treponema sp.]